MNTKRALIISSIIMALIIGVTIVSVSAAWFGDVMHKETSVLSINSARAPGEAQIDIDTAKEYIDTYTRLYPAKAVSGWLLSAPHYDNQEHIIPTPSGSTLRTANAGIGIQTAANVFKVYFPFFYAGTPDNGATDGKKAIKIYIDAAYIKIGTDEHGNAVAGDNPVNYIDDFYVDYAVVTFVKNGAGQIVHDDNGNPQVDEYVDSVDVSRVGEAVEFDFDDLTDTSSVFFQNDTSSKTLYLLVSPDYKDNGIEINISYNFLDEELNPITINKTIIFKVHIEVISRADLISGIGI